MMIHGGAWSIGGSGHLPPDQVTYLLEEGFAVVSPEYRLAPHVKLAECVEDLLDAYRFVQNGLNEVLGTELDVKRTCVMGWSAGGTGTLLLVTSSSAPIEDPSETLLTFSYV
jgi:acetyl esterase/lipase